MLEAAADADHNPPTIGQDGQNYQRTEHHPRALMGLAMAVAVPVRRSALPVGRARHGSLPPRYSPPNVMYIRRNI